MTPSIHDRLESSRSLQRFEYSLFEACQILHGHITGTYGGLSDLDAARLYQAISERIEAWTLPLNQSKAFDDAALALCQAVVAEYEGRNR